MKSFTERFWSRVDANSKDGCWPWLGCKNTWGYGAVRGRGKQLQAHRVAYELCIGPIPKGLCVCHHCDNPACVRPDHLFIGTHSDNTRDAYAKHRMLGNSKLTESEVMAIRQAFAAGDTTSELAKRFGLTRGGMWKVTHNISWKQSA